MSIRDGRPKYPDARVLVVDDDETSADTLERVLRQAGYTRVTTTSDPRKVLAMFGEASPDILLLDIRMPHLDGFAVMRQIRSRKEPGFLPILVITGDSESSVKEQALGSGANDFLEKPYDAMEVILRVGNLLRTRFLTVDMERQVRERTVALERSEVEIAQRLALAAELRDYQSGEHTQRVGNTSALIARAMGLPTRQVEVIRVAAPLHDIGKIAVPDRILLKDGPLTLDELEVVKHHTSFGAQMLSGSESEILQQAEEIALYHHENWDGTGYTPGLAGDTIPIAARIVHVADVFDALVHDRPYKKAWPVDEAVDLIGEGSGSGFDPDVVTAFLKVQATEGLPSLPDDFYGPALAPRPLEGFTPPPRNPSGAAAPAS